MEIVSWMARNNESITYVVVRNIVQEEAPSPSQEWPVNRGDGASEEGPLPVAKVGDGRVGVVQVREHDNPMVRQL
jgi:hypothetical protein